MNPDKGSAQPNPPRRIKAAVGMNADPHGSYRHECRPTRETQMRFTEEHQAIRATTARFIDAEINPHADEWEAEGIFPAHEVFRKMGELGLLGITKPVEYGGLGLDYSYQLVFSEELGRISTGGVGMAIGGFLPLRSGLRQRLLQGCKFFGGGHVNHCQFRSFCRSGGSLYCSL